MTNELNNIGLKDIIHFNSTTKTSAGKTLNVRFDGVDGQTLLLLLDKSGVCVSSGSACSGSATTASHVLLAMGISEEDAANSIRVSFSASNNDDEVIEAAHIIINCVRSLLDVKD